MTSKANPNITSIPYAPPSDDKTYLPLPHIPCHDAWRHTLSNQGLFEFIRTANFDQTGEPKRFLNALQPKEDCEKLLLSNQTQRVIPVEGREGGESSKAGKVRISTNNLPANGGEGEDRLAVHAINWTEIGMLQRDEESEAGRKTVWGRWNEHTKIKEEPDDSKDLIFCSVFDGHAGPEISTLLQSAAHTLLACGLATLSPSDQVDKSTICETVKKVYLTISQDISNASESVITHPQTSGPTSSVFGLPSMAQLHMARLEGPGSFYIAHLGDSRILANWENVDTGLKRVEVLTEDHNGCNPTEVERYKRAHPNDPNAIYAEKDAPYSRVLGGIMVTRAVGDVQFNRPEIERQNLLKEGIYDPFSIDHPTIDPPYMGWEPTVIVRPLLLKDGEGKNERLSSLIIASDGLWDKISNAEAGIALIAHQNSDPAINAITHQDILDAFPSISLPTDDPDARSVQNNRRYLLQDTNPATHLIRNAMSNGDEEQLQQMLSLKHGARMFRDDTAVVVVEFEREA